MTRFHQRMSKNRGLYKDPCEAFNAGVDLKASTDATWARKNGPKINGNDAAVWVEACDALLVDEAKVAPRAAEPNRSLRRGLRSPRKLFTV
jgi:hypothetical protein